MNYGVKGFLVGESLMRQEDVKAAAIELFYGVF
jgi:indole-3-glycerol phosphate synthase